MSLLNFIFYFLETVAAVSAISMIFVRNVFYGALLLITCLIALAGLYVLAFAEFIAVTQILIYAAGILVVIIFGIMLTSKNFGQAFGGSTCQFVFGNPGWLIFFWSVALFSFCTTI